jgi:hypothetical protein
MVYMPLVLGAYGYNQISMSALQATGARLAIVATNIDLRAVGGAV